MSRKPRLMLPGVPMHIIQRGNNRHPCFFDRTDYQVYLAMLSASAAEFACPIHAYVLMTNHVHILATPQATGASSALMKQVGQNYAQYINRRYERYGTLWQGRYRSCLVAEESYFLACHRYIELNPVRAAMTSHPAEYEWSSYQANACGAMSTLVTPHAIYCELGRHEAERQACYRALFDEVLSDEFTAQLRSATNGNFALASSERLDSMSVELQRDVRRQPAGRRPT